MEPTFTLPHVPALVSQLPSLETRSRSQFLEHCTGMQRQNIKDIIMPNLERFLNIKSSMEEALKYQREFASLFKREGAVLEERAMQLELELPSHVEVLKNELASLKNSLAQRQQQPSEQQPSAISWGEFSDDHSYLCPDDLFGNNKSLSPLRLLDETEETKLSFSPPPSSPLSDIYVLPPIVSQQDEGHIYSLHVLPRTISEEYPFSPVASVLLGPPNIEELNVADYLADTPPRNEVPARKRKFDGLV